MGGYDRHPDYGGKEPGPGEIIVLIAACALLIALVVLLTLTGVRS